MHDVAGGAAGPAASATSGHPPAWCRAGVGTALGSCGRPAGLTRPELELVATEPAAATVVTAVVTAVFTAFAAPVDAVRDDDSSADGCNSAAPAARSHGHVR